MAAVLPELKMENWKKYKVSNYWKNIESLLYKLYMIHYSRIIALSIILSS